MNNVVDIELDTIIAKLREMAPAIRALGVTKLAIFGSRARGDSRPNSDLDILVDTMPHGTARPFELFKVQHLIEDTIGISTQVSIGKLLKPRVAERIADDVTEVF